MPVYWTNLHLSQTILQWNTIKMLKTGSKNAIGNKSSGETKEDLWLLDKLQMKLKV